MIEIGPNLAQAIVAAVIVPASVYFLVKFIGR